MEMDKAVRKQVSEKDMSEGSPEAVVFADLVKWSQGGPKWQQDALRRLCLRDNLDESDIAELVALCKNGEEGTPLSLEHVKNATASGSTVTLKSISGVQSVNALAAGETLSFEKIGVTVIYGDNGSGKSGYARILKRACRARSPRGETILPNIYDAVTGVPTATIEFCENGNNRSATWIADQPADPMLSAVSVFDSRTANVTVNQANNVAYTPLPLKVLSALAQACQEVRQKLTADVEALKQRTPSVISNHPCKQVTEVGRLMANLSSAEVAYVTGLAELTDAEQARLATLNNDLAADPARLSRQLQTHKTQLGKVIARVEQLEKAASDENLKVLRACFREWDSARKAAQAASAELFSKEPLRDIGSEVWRALWESARNYSTASAFPGKPFPATEDGARCVLCLQELKAEAATRLTSFEAFVKNESKQREAATRQAYNEVIAALNAAAVPESERDSLVAFIENDLADAALAAEAKAAIFGTVARLSHIRDKHQDDEISVPALPASPVLQFRVISADLEQRSAALLSDSSSEVRKRLLTERDELADRAWLAGAKGDVIAEIGRRGKISALQNAIRDTTTNRITSKSGEVAESLVTNALRARFSKEVETLGVAGLAIELRQEKTTQGVPLFRVRLSRKPDSAVGEVLSEGEHRCVALAAFLAELSTTSSQSSIVFDDPVSSLDHMHREKVAKRLAAVACNQQVVVFTHDVSFVQLLNEECRAAGAHIAFRSVNRGTPFVGYCDANPPPNAQPVEKVIEGMGTHLENTRIQFERGRRADWYRTVRSFQEQLRTTWERAVEEVLSPVIRRFSNKVDTKRLVELTVLSKADCDAMRAAYGRCSALLHSDADALNRPLPNPDVIKTEIQALSDWVAQIRTRQRQAKSRETASAES